MSNSEGLKALGTKVAIPDKPDISILETFDNQHQDIDYLVPLVCGQFTSLCPKTGQPDWAKIEIIYVPRIKMVESKSLKLYLHSFRNTGEFHEDVINRIFKNLWEKMNPKYLRVIGNFISRGDIAIKPMVMKIADDVLDDIWENIQELVYQWDRKTDKLV